VRQLRVLALMVGSALIALASAALGQSKIPVPTPRPEYVHEVVPDVAPQSHAAAKRTVLTGAKLTLADAVFMGLRDNRAIKSAYIDRIAQKFDLKVAEDRFTPQFSVQGEVARQRIGDVISTTIDRRVSRRDDTDEHRGDV
jgi:hypothetical protein